MRFENLIGKTDQEKKIFLDKQSKLYNIITTNNIIYDDIQKNVQTELDDIIRKQTIIQYPTLKKLYQIETKILPQIVDNVKIKKDLIDIEQKRIDEIDDKLDKVDKVDHYYYLKKVDKVKKVKKIDKIDKIDEIDKIKKNLIYNQEKGIDLIEEEDEIINKIQQDTRDIDIQDEIDEPNSEIDTNKLFSVRSSFQKAIKDTPRLITKQIKNNLGNANSLIDTKNIKTTIDSMQNLSDIEYINAISSSFPKDYQPKAKKLKQMFETIMSYKKSFSKNKRIAKGINIRQIANKNGMNIPIQKKVVVKNNIEQLLLKQKKDIKDKAKIFVYYENEFNKDNITKKDFESILKKYNINL